MKFLSIFCTTCLMTLIATSSLWAGTPDPEIVEFEKHSVCSSLEGFTPDDVYKLDKVTAAFAAAPKELFHALDLPNASGRGDYTPTLSHKKDPLGLMTTQRLGDSQAFWEGIHPYPDFRLRGSYLSNHVPLLVWNLDGRWAVVVSIDGAVYRQEAKTYSGNKQVMPLKQVIQPKAKWPKPFHDTSVSTGDIQVWEQAKAVKAGTIDKLMKLKEKISACSDRTWSKYDRQFDKIDAANIRESTRENRYEQLARKVERQVVRSKCKKLIGQFEKITKGITNTRMKKRKALYKKASARLVKLQAE